MLESKLQRDIINRLKANGYLVYPICFRETNGCPDLVVMSPKNPLVVWLEVKTDSGDLSPNQIKIHSLMRGCSQAIFTVRSVDEAIDKVTSAFYDY